MNSKRRARWCRIGVRLGERAFLTLLLTTTIVAAAQVPAFLTLEVTHLPAWWTWEWVPPNRVTGIVVAMIIAAAWVQYVMVRIEMNRTGKR